jgi:hypothetical protein
MKQGKRESTLFEFLKAVDKFIFSDLKCSFARIRSPPGLLDSRPFLWNGYDVEPCYTLLIDLSRSLDTIQKGFEKNLRSGINSSGKAVSMEEGSVEDLDFLHSSLTKRLNEQGLELSISKSYLREIFDSFFPQNLKVFIVKYKGEKVGVEIIPFHGGRAYAWLGIVKTGLKGICSTDVLEWETIKWAKENGFQYYEFMDAGDEHRLSNYKSKFNPDLSIWFLATKYSSNRTHIAGKLYGLARKTRVGF